MGAAEVIAFEEVRARRQWDTLRHQLHERFDQWLDTLETQWHEPPSTLREVRGSRSFGTKNADPLEVIVFTGFLERLS
jgi:hypothetical protein